MRYTTPHSTKAMQGIGVLLIFLALIITATAIAAVLITQSQKMVERGQENYRASDNKFKTVQIAEIAGYDGTKQELSTLTIDVKSLIDEGYLSFDDLSIAIRDDEQRTILAYRGLNAPIEQSNDGYHTSAPQEFGELTYTSSNLQLFLSIQDDVPYVLPIDLDNDGVYNDMVEVCDNDASGTVCPAAYDGTHLVFTLSGTPELAYAELRNQDNTVANISTGSEVVDVVGAPISGGYGYISISGTITIPYEIDSGFVASIDKTGYLIQPDLNDDGQNDYLRLNATHFIINLSSTAEHLAYPLGVDLSGGAVTIDQQVRMLDAQGNLLGTATIAGTTSAADIIDEDVIFTINPANAGTGYYVVEHLLESSDFLPGRLVKGDVARIYLSPFQNITSDDIFTIEFLYANAEIIGKTVYAGNTFPNKQKVILFPKP